MARGGGAIDVIKINTILEMCDRFVSYYLFFTRESPYFILICGRESCHFLQLLDEFTRNLNLILCFSALLRGLINSMYQLFPFNKGGIISY